AFARLQQRLRAHYAQAAHLLHQSLRVGDDPVPADELGGNAAGVADGDRVGEDVAARCFVRLIGEILGLRAHVDLVLFLLRHGCIAELLLDPATPLSYLDHTLDKLDMVLLMSVNPGFGGQQFIASVLPKISEVRKRITASGKPIWLEVDGGIKTDNIAEVARAG